MRLSTRELPAAAFIAHRSLLCCRPAAQGDGRNGYLTAFCGEETRTIETRGTSAGLCPPGRFGARFPRPKKRPPHSCGRPVPSVRRGVTGRNLSSDQNHTATALVQGTTELTRQNLALPSLGLLSFWSACSGFSLPVSAQHAYVSSTSQLSGCSLGVMVVVRAPPHLAFDCVATTDLDHRDEPNTRRFFRTQKLRSGQSRSVRDIRRGNQYPLGQYCRVLSGRAPRSSPPSWGLFGTSRHRPMPRAPLLCTQSTF